MTDNDTHHREATASSHANRPQREGPEGRHLGDTAAAPSEGVNHDLVREATRLGTTDAYLVDQDKEDMDQRQGEDGADGRPSPLANADNPER